MTLIKIGRPLPAVDVDTLPGKGRPDWVQCDEDFIGRALGRARAREGGGWVVVDASRRVTSKPRRIDLAGQEWVLWKDEAGPVMAPNACPHLGAALCDSHVRDG
ncbi:MAG: hypothetical protein RLZZ383_2734, partial [Pseudomonadota bacterium]